MDHLRFRPPGKLRGRALLGIALLGLALLGAPLTQPATASDPLTLKDVLSKAQSEAETKAVNDLVDKLQGQTGRKSPAKGVPEAAPATPAAPPGAEPPSAPVPSATAPPAPSPGEPPKTSAPPEPTTPASTAPTAPEPAPAAEAAIAAAESERLPSVDLEVFFSYKSDAIEPQALPVLKTLGQALSDKRLAGDSFLIAGHTDAKGGKRFNRDLSRRRAEAVKDFLVANFGIDGSKLVARGFGYAHLKNSRAPLAPENRRVQIVNLSREQRP